jgi:hypothetical protein
MRDRNKMADIEQAVDLPHSLATHRGHGTALQLHTIKTCVQTSRPVRGPDWAKPADRSVD